MPTKLIERKISSEKVFSGELLQVYKDQVTLPDGGKAGREWIKHPGASAVLPVFKNGDVMLVKQFRYPLSQIFYEVPAGKIDKGEPPGDTAIRELKEETGLVGGNIAYVGHFHPAIGFSDEVIHFYVAWDLEESMQSVDIDEFVQMARMPLHEVITMIENGQITDGKTMVCVHRAMHWWAQNGPFALPGQM